jgi:hypothetical protein
MYTKIIFIFFDIFFQSINPILDYTYDNCDVIQIHCDKFVEDLENSYNSDNNDDNNYDNNDDNDNNNNNDTDICECFSRKIKQHIFLCFNDKNKHKND